MSKKSELSAFEAISKILINHQFTHNAQKFAIDDVQDEPRTKVTILVTALSSKMSFKFVAPKAEFTRYDFVERNTRGRYTIKAFKKSDLDEYLTGKMDTMFAGEEHDTSIFDELSEDDEKAATVSSSSSPIKQKLREYFTPEKGKKPIEDDDDEDYGDKPEKDAPIPGEIGEDLFDDRELLERQFIAMGESMIPRRIPEDQVRDALAQNRTVAMLTRADDGIGAVMSILKLVGRKKISASDRLLISGKTKKAFEQLEQNPAEAGQLLRQAAGDLLKKFTEDPNEFRAEVKTIRSAAARSTRQRINDILKRI